MPYGALQSWPDLPVPLQPAKALGPSGWDSPLTVVPRPVQLGALHLPSRMMPDASTLAAYFPNDDDKRRVWASSAAALLDQAAGGACCSPPEPLPSGGHALGLDPDLETAMQWLDVEIGPVEDAEKVHAPSLAMHSVPSAAASQQRQPA